MFLTSVLLQNIQKIKGRTLGDIKKFPKEYLEFRFLTSILTQNITKIDGGPLETFQIFRKKFSGKKTICLVSVGFVCYVKKEICEGGTTNLYAFSLARLGRYRSLLYSVVSVKSVHYASTHFYMTKKTSHCNSRTFFLEEKENASTRNVPNSL